MWVLYTLNCLDILGSLQTLLTKVTLERSKKKNDTRPAIFQVTT